MKNRTKLLISLAILIIISLFSISTLYKISKLDKDTIIDTYQSQLIDSVHTINLNQFNNQDLFNILDNSTEFNTNAIRTLRKSKLLYLKNSTEIDRINTLINQYHALNTANKYIKKYLLSNKLLYYRTFNSIITEIVNEINDPVLCFETKVFNSIIENLGINNVLGISIENLDFNDSLKNSYNIIVKSLFIVRWSSSASISSLKFDTFNSINSIVNNYPYKSINYEYKFINPTLDINGNLPLEDYINLKYNYTESQNNNFSKETFENNCKFWTAS